MISILIENTYKPIVSFYYSDITNLEYQVFISIKYKLMDRFWYSRCPNNYIDLPDMIGSFSSGAMASLVAKDGSESKLIQNYGKNHHQWSVFVVWGV